MDQQTILVIEDNELNMKLIKTLLKIGNFETLEAETAEIGIQLLQQHTPDLILMDIQLPGIDGLGATRKIKENHDWENIPVVAFTSYAMAGDHDKALKAGCSGYITKPIDTRNFLKYINSFLDQDK